MTLLEIACFNPESAAIAAAAGADRLELCSDQAAGGTTPPAEWLQQVKASVEIPVFVMIRPRGGDFHYSDAEFQKMLAQIDAFRADADGFVLGLLDAERRIDVVRTRQLVRRALPLPCTFHRAFDDTADLLQALEDVVDTGCRSILSSGGSRDAEAGADMLRRVVERADGRIVVMAGGGVRLSNVDHIRATSGVPVCHSSALLAGTAVPDAYEIRQMKAILSDCGGGT